MDAEFLADEEMRDNTWANTPPDRVNHRLRVIALVVDPSERVRGVGRNCIQFVAGDVSRDSHCDVVSRNQAIDNTVEALISRGKDVTPARELMMELDRETRARSPDVIPELDVCCECGERLDGASTGAALGDTDRRDRVGLLCPKTYHYYHRGCVESALKRELESILPEAGGRDTRKSIMERDPITGINLTPKSTERYGVGSKSGLVARDWRPNLSCPVCGAPTTLPSENAVVGAQLLLLLA